MEQARAWPKCRLGGADAAHRCRISRFPTRARADTGQGYIRHHAWVLAHHSARRAWLLIPPGFVVLFAMVVLLAAPDAGTRVFYAVLTVVTGLWLFRSWRAGVDVTTDGVVFRGQFRTRSFEWREIASASVEPMKSASPLSDSFPYVCVGVRLTSGAIRRSDLAASARRPEPVQAAVDDINRLKPRA